MKVVDIRSLSITKELGKGGQGTVQLVRAARPSGQPEEYAYKEYRRSGVRVDYGSLAGLTEFPDALAPQERGFLHAHAAWPLALVGDRTNRQSGFLMRLVPDDFFFTHQRSSGAVRAISEFQHLLNGPRFAAKLGFHHSPAELYELLAKTAEALAFLHQRGVTVGDISPKNICFRLHPTPEIFFLDCDAMALDGRSVTPQLETPGWEVPKPPSGVREPLGTRQSDAYKFGLLVLRTLAGNQDARELSSLDPSVPFTVRNALGRTLAQDPRERHSIAQWPALLHAAAQRARSTPPAHITVDARQTLDRPGRPLDPYADPSSNISLHEPAHIPNNDTSGEPSFKNKVFGMLIFVVLFLIVMGPIVFIVNYIFE